MSTPCPFCERDPDDRIIEEDEGWYSKIDPYPVSPGHALLIPKAHVESLRDLDPRQGTGVLSMLKLTVNRLEYVAPRPIDAWTFAVNDGEAAGRTVNHLHIHLIPRYFGDLNPSVGGIRRMFIPDPTDDPWQGVAFVGVEAAQKRIAELSGRWSADPVGEPLSGGNLLDSTP